MKPFQAIKYPIRTATIHARVRGCRGFTLVELLVATGLASLVLVMLMGLLDGSLRAYQSSSGNLMAYSEARHALNRAMDELGGAVILQPDNTAPLDPGQPMPKAMVVALVQDHPALGDFSGVAFVQRRRNTGAGDLIITAYRYNDERFLLERAEIDSESVWLDDRNYSLETLDGDDFDWRPICQGVTGFDLAFFTSAELISETPGTAPSIDPWNTRLHGRPALGRLTLEVIDPFSFAVLMEVGSDSTTGQRLIEEKPTALRREILF